MAVVADPKTKIVPTVLSSYRSGTGSTITVGNEYANQITYTGSQVSSNLADAATAGGSIASPGAWTDLVDLHSGPYNIQLKSNSTGITYYQYGVFLQISSSEDSGDAIRVQVIRDGETIWDGRVVSDASGTHIAGWYALQTSNSGSSSSGSFSSTIYCKSSFKIRGTRIGTMSSSGTICGTGSVLYENVREE